MEKSNIIAGLIDRLNILEKEQAEGKKSSKTAGKKKPPVDVDVCPSCGNDLVYVEEGIVYCEKCKEYYEHEEEKEE